MTAAAETTPLAHEPRTAGAFLEDWCERGIAEERHGRWRLTRSGRAMFAAYISNLELADQRDDEAAA